MQELITIIEQLILDAQSEQKSRWWRRSTMTPWIESYEYSKYQELQVKLDAIREKYPEQGS